MRYKLLIFAGTFLGGVIIFFGIRTTLNRAPRPEGARRPSAAAPLAGGSSFSERQFRLAQNLIKNAPSDPEGYNMLCGALIKRARETGDFAFNAKAEAALNQSFKLAPDNYDALKLKASLLLTYHRFGEALEVARRAQGLNPRDHENYGAITDALVELGDYKGAVEAAQTMVDLKPNSSSYSRVSYLRALHGDAAGAIHAMRAAAEAANPQDLESIAWCRVQLGNELINAKKLADGEREIDRALYTFPDYHLALAAKGRARLAAGDTGRAVEFYERATGRVPLPEYAIALGDLYTKLGRVEDAKRQYDLVEFIESDGAVEGTYSRQLALFWADHDMRLDDALAVAERESASRKDIYTSDTLAWCLYKKKRFAEAKAAMDDALRLGTRDARLFYHAGMIASALGDHPSAAKYLKRALEIDPSFDPLQADVARQTLATIKA